MDDRQIMRVMERYLEDMGIRYDLVPFILETARRTPGGLLELRYYVLDEGKGLSQKMLLEKAESIGGTQGNDAA